MSTDLWAGKKHPEQILMELKNTLKEQLNDILYYRFAMAHDIQLNFKDNHLLTNYCHCLRHSIKADIHGHKYVPVQSVRGMATHLWCAFFPNTHHLSLMRKTSTGPNGETVHKISERYTSKGQLSSVKAIRNQESLGTVTAKRSLRWHDICT